MKAASALVAAVAASDDRVERHYLEVKSDLDLSQKNDITKIAKFIRNVPRCSPVRLSLRGTKRSLGYEVRVFAEVDPAPDPAEFARIIMRIAEEQQAKDEQAKVDAA